MPSSVFIDSSFAPRTPADLKKALPLAIAFEHATIPIYLYALYSLDPSRNMKIARLIESVVKEEMLHMLLACNLSNAIGCPPNLRARTFIPDYPRQVPGMIAQGLQIGLEPFSKRLVEQTFMKIEAPDDPIGVRVESPDDPNRLSVGEFYGLIRDQLCKGGSALFARPTGRQIGSARMPGVTAVTDLKSALEAIETIVEQGEGTPVSPKTPAGDYAHYYRFAEILHGREIVPNPAADERTHPDERYLYEGPRVPFDPEGVWPVKSNPKAKDYRPRTRARRAMDTFNYTYTTLLARIDDLTNDRGGEFDATLGMMYSMKHQAIEMMSGIAVEDEYIGPSFEYQPIVPD